MGIYKMGLLLGHCPSLHHSITCARNLAIRLHSSWNWPRVFQQYTSLSAFNRIWKAVDNAMIWCTYNYHINHLYLPINSLYPNITSAFLFRPLSKSAVLLFLTLHHPRRIELQPAIHSSKHGNLHRESHPIATDQSHPIYVVWNLYSF